MADLAIRSTTGDDPVVETLHRGPLSWLTYLERNGRFYKIAEEVVDKGLVSGPKYELSRDSETESISPDDAISFADLPRHDRWRVNEAADLAIEHLDGMRFSIPFVAGYLDSDAQDESVLAAGVEASAIRADSGVAELDHVGAGEGTAKRFRYTAETVFEDADAFADYVLERRGSTSFEPSDDVRMLLDEAKETDGHVMVCDDDTSEEEDEEAAERRREAASELETMLASLEAESERNDDVTSEQVEYVLYEGSWHRIDVTSSYRGV
ncbi:hypothetical protein [Natrinema salinisoli]|uniref:hypothetical protein n=1 Tax=Natrinema salinisoli TaxID=2878535 RepID=UPI001CF09474|nr:hypothetical protein [Natrinema salinisoli]